MTATLEQLTSGERPEVAILIGLQGSGKTTFYRHRLAVTHVHVSKDLMRSAKRRRARQQRLILEALEAGRSVAVDNTNPSPLEREPIIELARAHGARIVGYLFPLDVAAQSARNATRTGRARVPDVGIYATVKRFRPPSLDEGFDALYSVTFAPGGEFEVAPMVTT
jgi:predicted kinase